MSPYQREYHEQHERDQAEMRRLLEKLAEQERRRLAEHHRTINAQRGHRIGSVEFPQ